jgi:hypothetical protein
MDAFVAFPFGPLTPFRTVAYKETTRERRVWGIGRWIKVERDLDPNIPRTRYFRVGRFRGVEFEPSKFELFRILRRDPCTVGTSLGE